MDKRHQLCVKSWLHGTYSPASLLLKATTHHITHKYGLQIKKGRDKQSKTILKMKRYDTLKEEKTGYLDAWWITTTNGMWNEVSETGQWYDWHASLSSETHCPIPLWLNRPLTTAQEDLFVFWFMKWAECNQAIKTIVLKEIVCEGVILRTDIANMWNKQLNLPESDCFPRWCLHILTTLCPLPLKSQMWCQYKVQTTWHDQNLIYIHKINQS